MRRLLILIAAVALLVVVLPAASAVAAPPLGVDIEVEENFEDPGVFTASGPAVDEGLLCESGTTEDLVGKASGNGPWGFNAKVLKVLTCDDGSGTFLVKLQVRVLFEGPIWSTFNWTVMGGTGAYVGLHGSGDGVGLEPTGAFDILDVYSGGMH